MLILPLEWVPRRKEPIPTSLLERHGPLLGTFLWARGLDSEDSVENFLNPKLEDLSSPFKILNMKAASLRLAAALSNNESIAVYADYDMDGMSGLALLVSFFESCGAKTVTPYQPHRFEDGYGVHPDAIRTLADQGIKVIVTVDTGISASEAALEAKKCGVDLIITDHHKQLSDLPETPYILNPNQRLDDCGMTYLSGAGMAFYFAIAVRATLRSQGYFTKRQLAEPDLRQWLDLFVLGTVADSVDLVGDNRALVRSGLRQLIASERPGIKALRELTVPNAKYLSARDVSFSITPKLNAASRLGKAHLSTELLMTKDSARAQELASELMSLNEERGRIQSQVFDEAFGQAQDQVAAQDPPVLVVHGDWHEGVLGVVAAKLTEKFSRPTIVLTKVSNDLDMLRGSMRTLAPVSCVKALDACQDLLHKYGGHAMAAGLQMKSRFIDDFSDRIWQSTRNFLSTLTEKAIVSFDDFLPQAIDLANVEALEVTSPWGSGNPEPLYRVNGIELGSIQMMGGGQHLKCQIMDGITVIGFFKAEDVERLKKIGARRFDALVTPEINRFRNQKTVQLRLQYVRPSETSDSVSRS